MDRVGQRLVTELVHDELALQRHIHLRARKSTHSIHAGVDEQGMEAARPFRLVVKSQAKQVGSACATWASYGPAGTGRAAKSGTGPNGGY